MNDPQKVPASTPSMTGVFRVVAPSSVTGPRRTKIVATLGPSTSDPAVVVELALAGMDAARLNFSHGSHADHAASVSAVRHAEEVTGRRLAVIADLCGPKIRLGPIADRRVEAGDLVTFGPAGLPGDQIPITMDDLAQRVRSGDRLLIDDGKVRTRAVTVDGSTVTCLVEAGGVLRSRKGVNLPDTPLAPGCLTQKDVADLEFALQCNVDYVAVSFVREPEDLRDVARRIAAAGTPARIIAKIERPEAIANLAAMVEAADAVMVARGDLGVEMGVAEVPMLQKQIVDMARRQGKTVITATQMLESMIESSEPTRAEVSDVANAILDGTSAVMLSAETASGINPVRAVSVLDEVARSVEPTLVPRLERVAAAEVATIVMRTACEVADEVRARAIVVPTTSGSTPRDLARFRPRQPVLAACHHIDVLRQLALDWGVVPLEIEDADVLESAWMHAIDRAIDLDLVGIGDLVVLTGRRSFAADHDASHVALHRISAVGALPDLR